jgi:teichuronic acid exporter
MKDLKERKSFLNAIKWSYTASWGERGFSAIFTFVLAAVLGPSSYGAVSIALIYIGFLQLFLDQGLVAALIQKLDLEPEHLDTVFWLNQIMSVILVGVSFLLSAWWAARNHAPELHGVISLLSLDIPIASMATVQSALIRREMNFKGIAYSSNIATLASGVVGVVLAFTGFGIWALVWQQLSRDLLSCTLLWRINSWRPRFRFSMTHLRQLMNFSSLNFAAQLALFAEAYASTIVLGLFYGPVAVGLYRLADRLMSSVLSMTTASIQSVALPEFSRFQNSPGELRNSVLTCIRLSSAVTLPALAGLAAISMPLMAFEGAEWVPATGVLKLLCAIGAALLFAFFTGPLMQALSRTRDLMILSWSRSAVGILILMLVAVFIKASTVSTQLMGIGAARFITGALLVDPICLFILMRLSGTSFRDIASAIAPGAFAALAVLVVVFLVGSLSSLTGARNVVLLASEIVVGALVGGAVLLTMEKQLRNALMSLLRRSAKLNSESNLA